MIWTRNRKYIELLTKFPPWEECEDYYDFCDHVASLCKEHHVCLDDKGSLLDISIDAKVSALLEFARQKETLEYNLEQLGMK